MTEKERVELYRLLERHLNFNSEDHRRFDELEAKFLEAPIENSPHSWAILTLARMRGRITPEEQRELLESMK